MTKNHYHACRLAIIVVLAMSISIAISLNHYYLPLVFMLSAIAGIYYCRGQLKTDDVMVDERDYKVAGDAARYTIYIYGWIGAVATFILMAFSGKQGKLYVLSLYLAFSVCFLLLMNAFLFKYFSNRGK